LSITNYPLLIMQQPNLNQFKESEIDSFTKLLNRDKSTEELNRILSLAKLEQRSFSLVIINLDYLKNINDIYGYRMGDQVLRCFAEKLQENFNGEDILGRWAGDTFIIGMYGMDKYDAFQRLNDFFDSWNKQLFYSQTQFFSVTFSAGIADYTEDNNDFARLYEMADYVLLKAKLEGRDRILFS
ncbi:MAG TPA: GGDEF domain-containing protein, partial [Allocoleopsis sp.]